MKKFLIIGSANAITYKEIFPYIASGEWFIRSANGKISFIMRFTTSNGEERNVPSLWYTNLDSRHLYQSMKLTEKYKPEKYPKYDNYDAIEVSKLRDIPCDYDGVMGVPISVVLFSPNQFEIIGEANHGKDSEWDLFTPSVDGKTIFKRILIKQVQDKKKVDFEIIGCPDANVLPDGWRGMTKEFVDLYYAQGNTGQYQEGKRLAYYVTKDGMAKVPYKRILIKRVSKNNF